MLRAKYNHWLLDININFTELMIFLHIWAKKRHKSGFTSYIELILKKGAGLKWRTVGFYIS